MTSPGHVGIITGHGMMIVAPATSQNIQTQPYIHQPGLVGFTDPAAVR
jgi:hypothetical protein